MLHFQIFKEGCKIIAKRYYVYKYYEDILNTKSNSIFIIFKTKKDYENNPRIS